MEPEVVSCQSQQPRRPGLHIHSLSQLNLPWTPCFSGVPETHVGLTVGPSSYIQRTTVPSGGTSLQWQLPPDGLLGARHCTAILCVCNYQFASDSEDSTICAGVFKWNCLTCCIPLLRGSAMDFIFQCSSSVKCDGASLLSAIGTLLK